MNTHLPQISQLLQKLILSFNANLLALRGKDTQHPYLVKEGPLSQLALSNTNTPTRYQLSKHTHTHY